MIILFKYRSAGVREYWVVDPERELVTIYNFEKDTMEESRRQKYGNGRNLYSS